MAIVTGGARGIGRGCAHALAERGHAVALVDLLVPEMQRTKGEIEAMGVPCLTFSSGALDRATIAVHSSADVAEHLDAETLERIGSLAAEVALVLARDAPKISIGHSRPR